MSPSSSEMTGTPSTAATLRAATLVCDCDAPRFVVVDVMCDPSCPEPESHRGYGDYLNGGRETPLPVITCRRGIDDQVCGLTGTPLRFALEPCDAAIRLAEGEAQ